MKYLLDTHVLLWWLSKSRKLTRQHKAVIENSENRILVSVASLWEIAIKVELGKLRMPDDLMHQVQDHDFEVLPITAAHALAAGALPLLHSDPFDRMLISQAQLEQLTLISVDEAFSLYEVRVL